MKLALVFVLAACSSKAAQPAPLQIRVHVDHRIETVAILERLAGASEATRATGPYARDVDAAFSRFNHHPAVELTRELHNNGFAFERPMDFAIHLDDQLNPIDIPDTAKLAAAVRAFSTDAKVETFFAAHRDYISAVEHVFAKQIAASDPVPFFTQLVGATHTNFTIVPALLQGPQNYGVHRGDDAYQLIGLGTVDEDGLPTVIDGDVIVHEMAHSFVNAVIDQHAAELDAAAEALFPLVAPQMTSQHYTTPRIMLYESVVRAITASYVRSTRGDRAAAVAIRGEVRRGFVWTAELESVIAKTKLDVPAIAAFFTATAKKYEHGLPPLAFLGPIDAVYQHPIAIVASPATRDYAASINNTIFAGKWPVSIASNSSFDDHPHVGLVAYGSAATNPIVDAITQRAGWSVTADNITLGKKHWTGPHLLLIATWLRGDDPTQGVVVYTAADDADVDQANAMRAGPTDWVVGQKTATGFTILDSGDFPHAADGAWTMP